MKLDRLRLAASALAGAFAVVSTCEAQPLIYETSLANAITRAKDEGKIVIGDFGEPACTECIATFATWDLPEVKGWLQASIVPWWVDVQASQAWVPYAGDIGGAALPVLVWIDPNDPNYTHTYFFRTTGLLNRISITYYVTNEVMRYLPLMVLNMPGQDLTNPVFTVQGMARTDPLTHGAVVNVAISNIVWRLEMGANNQAPFQSVQTMNNAGGTITQWSQQVVLNPGTNVFASYLQYVNGANSWTNRITLVYDGPPASLPPTITGTVSRSPDTINLAWATVIGQTYQIQTSVDLAQGVWTNLGPPVTGTGLTASVSDAIGTGLQRFYRVALLP